jgi:hypothetical protein
MSETTSKLFEKLRSPGGRTLLDQEPTAPSCAKALRDLLERTGICASDWIAAADISRSYGYQILRGERIPGRDILLRTALAVRLSVEETQRLLTLGGCAVLYPRIRRDAAVIFALNQSLSLLETESLLSSLPERSLYAGEA